MRHEMVSSPMFVYIHDYFVAYEQGTAELW